MFMLPNDKFEEIQIALEKFILIVVELLKFLTNELTEAAILKILKIKFFWNQQQSENTVFIEIFLEIFQKCLPNRIFYAEKLESFQEIDNFLRSLDEDFFPIKES